MVFDPLYLLFVLPGLLLTLWAQARVRGAYAAYARRPNRLGLTGAQAARAVLDRHGLVDVPIEPVAGELTDHYDPGRRVLRLSAGVYGVPSVAALGIAAHEAGHAIQHAGAYAPLRLRTAIAPAASLGSNVGLVLLLLGVAVGAVGVAWLGVGLFALATLFALVTLPVEFDASRRARAALASAGLVTAAEGEGVAKVLDAAAWTYVAGFAVALLELLYWVAHLTGARQEEQAA